MPRGPGRYVGRAGRRRRTRSTAQAVVWVAAVPVALAFLLLLAQQSRPLAVVIFFALAAFAWFEWRQP